MTTVAQEIPDFVPGQQAFLATARGAGAEVEHIHLPEALHGFDSQSPTEGSRRAVTEAVDALAHALTRSDAADPVS